MTAFVFSLRACLRARINGFLASVEADRDAWIVLFREMTASKPVAEATAELRHETVEAVRKMLEAGASPRPTSHGLATAAIAHAIVGAGESLANWWLEHPEVPRDQVADLYLQVAQPAFTAARGRKTPKSRPARGAAERRTA